MDYRKELDALMGETAALVARTTVTASQTSQPTAPRPQAPINIVVSILSEPGRPAPQPDTFGLSERDQIGRCVATFKAHQERFRREREDFYSTTIRRARDLADGRTTTGVDEP